MKKLLALLLLFGIVGCSNEEETVPASSHSMMLSCKYNPSALYTDKLYFSEDMSSISRTSNNKNIKSKSYTTEKMSLDEYIVKGTKTVVDINKNETKYPDSNLYVLNKEGSKYWILYYFEDYDTDPFRFMVCNQS